MVLRFKFPALLPNRNVREFHVRGRHSLWEPKLDLLLRGLDSVRPMANVASHPASRTVSVSGGGRSSKGVDGSGSPMQQLGDIPEPVSMRENT